MIRIGTLVAVLLLAAACGSVEGSESVATTT